MDLLNKMKKNPRLYPVWIALLIFIFIYISYLAMVTFPRLNSAKALNAAKTQIEAAKLHLSGNSVLYYRFLSFDTSLLTFGEEKEELLLMMKNANEDAISFFTQSPELSVPLIASKSSRKYLNGIKDPFLASFPESKEVLENQQGVISELETLQELLKNIYLYDPRYDFSELKNYQVNEDRAATARLNLEKIRENIERSDLEGKEDLIDQLNASLSVLGRLESAFKSKDDTLITREYLALQKEFTGLKSLAYDKQKDIIKGPENLEYLKKEMELLDMYQKMIDEAALLQNELNTDPLLVALGKLNSLLTD